MKMEAILKVVQVYRESSILSIEATPEVAQEIAAIEGVNDVRHLGSYRYSYVVEISQLYDFSDVTNAIVALGQRDPIPEAFMLAWEGGT